MTYEIMQEIERVLDAAVVHRLADPRIVSEFRKYVVPSYEGAWLEPGDEQYAPNVRRDWYRGALTVGGKIYEHKTSVPIYGQQPTASQREYIEQTVARSVLGEFGRHIGAPVPEHR
jgi:hypothetical protein